MFTKNVGEVFDVIIEVQDVVDVVGLGCYFIYNPNIIEPVDKNPNALGTQLDYRNLGFIPSATLICSLAHSNGVEIPGRIIASYMDLNSNAVSGSGDCFAIKFKAKFPGSTTLVFSNQGLFDIPGNNVEANWVNSSMEVSQTTPPPPLTMPIITIKVV